VLTKQGLGSVNISAALVEMARNFHLQNGEKLAVKAATPDEQYKAERVLLEEFHFVPIAFVPQAYWLSSRVRNWNGWTDGRLHLDRIWIDSDRQQ